MWRTVAGQWAPLARTKKGGARRGGAKLKNNGAVVVARKKNGANSRNFRAIFEPNFAYKSLKKWLLL